MGVRKREFEGVDDAPISPISADESTIPAKLLSSLLKPGGGATGVVTRGGLRSCGGTELGKVFLF